MTANHCKTGEHLDSIGCKEDKPPVLRRKLDNALF